jgi:hypothetical protein
MAHLKRRQKSEARSQNSGARINKEAIRVQELGAKNDEKGITIAVFLKS